MHIMNIQNIPKLCHHLKKPKRKETFGAPRPAVSSAVRRLEAAAIHKAEDEGNGQVKAGGLIAGGLAVGCCWVLWEMKKSMYYEATIFQLRHYFGPALNRIL